MGRFLHRLALVIFALCIFHLRTAAQTVPEKPTPGAKSPTASQHGSGGHEEGKFPEIEALISNEFRTVSYVQPIYRGLHFEGHYFGVKREIEGEHGATFSTEPHHEYVDVATLGASWSFSLGEHVKLIPGFGVYLGDDQRTAPAFTFRWDIEKGWLISQGLFVASLRDLEDRVSIWDGNHVSVRWKRLQIGPSWERIHTRDENEWKGGVRGSVRIARHLSVAAFVLAPKFEFRAGVIIHPGE